jgi:hypothetical protein
VQAACEQGATALHGFAATATWARGRAEEAVRIHAAGLAASQRARADHQRRVDAYNAAASAYNTDVAAGADPGPPPTEPAPFVDPGLAEQQRARDLLARARAQRDSAGQALQAALGRATDGAPPAPGTGQQLLRTAEDTPGVVLAGLEHLNGGAAKGLAEMGRFARSLDPMDPYNVTHPAAFVEGVGTTVAGLGHSIMHPTELVSGLVGTGWGKDPAEAMGKLLANVATAVPTGGGGAAAGATDRVLESGAANAARSAATRAAEQAATRAAEHATEQAGARAGEHATADAPRRAVPDATGRAPSAPAERPAVPAVERSEPPAGTDQASSDRHASADPGPSPAPASEPPPARTAHTATPTHEHPASESHPAEAAPAGRAPHHHGGPSPEGDAVPPSAPRQSITEALNGSTPSAAHPEPTPPSPRLSDAAPPERSGEPAPEPVRPPSPPIGARTISPSSEKLPASTQALLKEVAAGKKLSEIEKALAGLDKFDLSARMPATELLTEPLSPRAPPSQRPSDPFPPRSTTSPTCCARSNTDSLRSRIRPDRISAVREGIWTFRCGKASISRPPTRR